jgi:rhamnogalacturonyl hydrolase YesR
MIGYALLRGLDNGWLDGRDYERAVERAWVAVSSRTSSAGGFVDVCESTARMTSLEEYLRRAASLGPDPRAGAMVLMFATELMAERNQ